MKKVVIGTSVIFAIVFYSCAKKQTWNCQCQVSGSSTNSYTTTITNATKSNASDLCYKAAGSKLPANSFVCQVSSP